MVMVAGIAIENVYFKQSLSNFVCLGAFSEGFSFFFFFLEGGGREWDDISIISITVFPEYQTFS